MIFDESVGVNLEHSVSYVLVGNGGGGWLNEYSSRVEGRASIPESENILHMLHSVCVELGRMGYIFDSFEV